MKFRNRETDQDGEPWGKSRKINSTAARCNKYVIKNDPNDEKNVHSHFRKH